MCSKFLSRSLSLFCLALLLGNLLGCGGIPKSQASNPRVSPFQESGPGFSEPTPPSATEGVPSPSPGVGTPDSSLSDALPEGDQFAGSEDAPVRFRTVAYGSHERQTMDVFPKDPGSSLPILIYVHGGGLQTGDKSRHHSKAPGIEEQGYLFIAPNYRLSPEVQHPAHVEDLALAMRTIVDQAESWGGDPHRIALVGHSAGAWIAALLSVDPRWLQAVDLDLDAVDATVLLDCAAYDLPWLAQISPQSFERTWAPAFGQDPKTWMDASSSYQLGASERAPKHLLVHTPKPRSTAATRNYFEALLEAGHEAQIYEAPGATHKSLNKNFGSPEDPTTQVAFAFLEPELSS